MTQKIQLRGGTAAEARAANPVLAVREIAVETDTGLCKVGDGVTPWNALPYSLQALNNVSGYVDFSQTPTPSVPNVGHLNLYAKSSAGRIMLTQLGPSGTPYAYQPHLGGNRQHIVTATGANGFSAVGCTIATGGSLGTLVTTANNAAVTTLATAATAAASAILQVAAALFNTGLLTNVNKGGLHFRQRFYLPDSSYDGTAASTGSRIAVGVTSLATNALTSADTPAASSSAVFRRVHNFGVLTQANWQFFVAGGTTGTHLDTGLPFLPACQYFAQIFIAPGSNVVNWQIENETTGKMAYGSTQVDTPVVGVLMRETAQITTINAVIRRIGVAVSYCESDM